MGVLSFFPLLIFLSRVELRAIEAQTVAQTVAQALLREIIVYQQQQAVLSSYSTRGKSFFQQQFGGWQHSVFEAADWKLLETQTDAFLQARRSSALHDNNLVFFQPRLYPPQNLKLNLQDLLAEGVRWDNADSGPAQALQVLPTSLDEPAPHNFTVRAGYYKYSNANSPRQCAILYVEPVERFRGCVEHFLLETQAVSSHTCLDDIPAEDFSKTLDRLEVTAPQCFQEYLHMFSDYDVTNYFEHVEPELKALRRQLRDSAALAPVKRAKFKRLIRLLQQQGRPPYSIPYIAWNRTIFRVQQCEVVVLHRPESYALLAQKLPAHLHKADCNLSAIVSQASKDLLSRQLHSITGVINKQKVFVVRGKHATRNMRDGRCPSLAGEKRRTVERKLALEVVLFRLANEQIDRQLLQAQLPVLKSCLQRSGDVQADLRTGGADSKVPFQPPSLLITNGGASGYIAETLLCELTGISIGKYWQRISSNSSPGFTAPGRKRNSTPSVHVDKANCRADTEFLHMESGFFRMQPSHNLNQSVVIDTSLFDAFEDRICRRAVPVVGSHTVSNGQALLSAISKGVVVMRDPYLYVYRNAFRNLSIEMESSGKLGHGQMEDRLVKALQTFVSRGTAPSANRASITPMKTDNEPEDRSDSRLVKDLQLHILNREDIFSKLSLAQEQEIARFQELRGNESEIFASVFRYFFDPLTFVSLFRVILQQDEIVYAERNFLFMSLEAVLDASFQLLNFDELSKIPNTSPVMRVNPVSRLLQFTSLSVETLPRLQCGFVDTMRRLSSSSAHADILSLQEETLEMRTFYQRYPRLFVETRGLLEKKWKQVAIVVKGTPIFLF